MKALTAPPTNLQRRKATKGHPEALDAKPTRTECGIGPGLRSTRLRWRVLYPQTYPQCTQGKGKWQKMGKMGENGGKWGGNGEKWGEMGENGGNLGGATGPLSPHFLPISSPFSPIFPHFPPGAFPIFPNFSSGPFTNAPPPPPPTALLPTSTLIFGPFSP